MSETKQTKQKIKPLIHVFIAGIILFVWKFAVEFSDDVLWAKALVLSCVYVFCLVWWVKSTQYINSVFFYFLCYTALTNAGQLALYALGIEIVGIIDVFVWATDAVIVKSMDFQLYCTVFMCTCAIIAHEIHSEKEKPIQETVVKTQLQESKYISWPELIFIVSGIIYSVYNLLRLESRVDATYLDAFNARNSQDAPFILVLLFYITFYMVCYSHRAKGDEFKKIIIIVSGIVGLTTLLFGSRNVLIPIVFGMIFLWGKDIKTIPIHKKVIAVAAALFFLYLIGAFVNVRRMAMSELTFEVLMDALFGEGISDQLVMLISEMGGSLRVLTTTISDIDSGVVESEQTLLYTFLKGIVPDMSILEMLDINEPERWRLSAWITEKSGENAGWGYSMYAEAYYNFKELGYLFMGAFGYAFSWLECKIARWYSKGYTVVASAWLFFATYVIFLARADSLLITPRIRYALYLSIACVLLRGRVKIPAVKFKWRQRRGIKEE